MSARTLVCALAALAMAATADAQLNRSFVSVGGSDANPCTPAAPCRSFAAAIAVTNPAGEVVAVDSGGFGPFVIDRTVTVLAAPGVHAAITASSGDAITSNPGGFSGSATVRGLSLSSQGAANGIRFQSGIALNVENVTISGFPSWGIVAASTNGGPVLHVIDVTIRGASTAVYVGGVSPQRAVIERTRSLGCSAGFFFINAEGVVTNSLASGGSNSGVIASIDATVTVVDTVASAMGSGFSSTGGSLVLSGSAAAGNTYGIVSQGTGALVSVAGSTISGNDTGVFSILSGTIHSLGNNVLRYNAVNGTFDGTFPPQ